MSELRRTSHGGGDIVRGGVMGGRGWDVANHMGGVWGGAVDSGGVTSL